MFIYFLTTNGDKCHDLLKNMITQFFKMYCLMRSSKHVFEYQVPYSPESIQK